MRIAKLWQVAAVLGLAAGGMARGQAAVKPEAVEPMAKDAAPDFGPNVLVFDPSMGDIQRRIDAVFARQEKAQFGAGRYAYLFKPGAYAADVQVGFGMEVLGLGASPDDVAITGAVRAKATWMKGNATCNFWRAAANLSVTPTQDKNVNVWAVSQATSLRRVHVKGNLALWDGGWSSGGYIADSLIDGTVDAGSQQQWISRNAAWGNWKSGGWNMVFVGVENPPVGQWPEPPYTVIEKAPVTREKPYLVIDGAGKYFVQVPALAKETKGITWKGGAAAGTRVPIGAFFIARADRDSATTINAALEAGQNVLLTPGVYALDDTIRVKRAGTIVLGIGYPTLVATTGAAAMTVADVDGVKLAGVLFEAGEKVSPVLLEVGAAGSKASHAGDPTFLWDIFCRAGGAAVGRAERFVTIHSRDVVGENFWLWQADHGKGAGWDSNKVDNGLVVDGDDVTIYGLFVEHTQGYQTVWNGERGRMYFYQSEFPYTVPSAEAWGHDGVRGFASYKVGDGVKAHEAWGLGMYSVFTRASIVVDNAIETPDVPGVKMHHMVTHRLTGKPGSGIAHVINGKGEGAFESPRMAHVK